MKIVAWSDPSGARSWRLLMPFKWINKEGKHSAYVSENGINDIELNLADVIVFHNVVNKEGISEALAVREISGYKKKIVVDMDDALFVNPDNPHKKDWDTLDASFVITQTIKQADIVTCTTENLRKKLLEFNKNVVVLPNYYDPGWFDVKPIENKDGTVRIGWSGSATHLRDIKMIIPLLEEMLEKYRNTKLILFGDDRLIESFQHKERIECRGGAGIEYYPQLLNSLALDIGIAPLVDDEFNSYKSPIKAIEYGLVKLPVVCSEIVYSEISTVKRCANYSSWKENLEYFITHEKERRAYGLAHYKNITKHYNLKDHYHKWIDTYTQI